MKHIPAHLWASLESLSETRRAAMFAHADRCERCNRARERIGSLPEVFAEICDLDAPDLEWDHVGARIHWSRSLAKRTGQHPVMSEPVKRRGRWLAIPALALGAIAVTVAWVGLRDGTSGPLLSAADVESSAVPILRAAMPVELRDGRELEAMVVRTAGVVTVDGEALDWRKSVVAGQRIETGAGELTVQFARGGGFSVGAESSVQLRAFDTHSIELVLDGTLEVQVSKRARHQQFLVVAADRTVSVRGTAFRVRHRGGDLDVACEHGRVEVSDGRAVVGIDGNERLVVEKSADLASGGAAIALEAAEHEALAADLRMPLLQSWNGVELTLASSTMLSILASEAADVSIDGVRVGAGSMQVRLLLGRHQVAVGGAGPWSNGRWLELDGGQTRIVHANTGASAGSTGSARIRRVQLRLAIRENSGLLRRCVARFAARDAIAGLFLDLDVLVNVDGTLGSVNAGASNADLDVRRCVLSAVSSLKLPRGPKSRARIRWQP